MEGSGENTTPVRIRRPRLRALGAGLAERVRALGRWSRRRPRQAALLAVCALGLYSAALIAGGAVGGARAQKSGLIERAEGRIERVLLGLRVKVGADEQVVPWRRTITNLHTIETANIQVYTQRTGGGGALAEVGGHIVFVSPMGRFSALTAQNRLMPLELTAPVGIERLRQSPLINDPLFVVQRFRTNDLLARETEPGRWDLYLSFNRFAGDNCFQFVVARAKLEASADAVRAVSQEWEDVFVARPGCIRHKDRSWLFVGGGGRIVELDANTLLISIGDHQFDGVNDSWSAPMDPATDLGKIVAIDLATRQARVYATGVRDPQGLVVTRDRRIFETEHGPQGGDEINFIREGGVYGWPIVTYGVNYGYPRSDWPFNPTPGAHEGYDRPAMAFTPAIGISNLIEADPAEFPLWRNDLLVASLRGRALYHVHTEGERIAYAEPIVFPDRDRLRDIIALADGRIAMLTDSGTILLARNAERHRSAPRELVVSGLKTLSAPLPEEAPPRDPRPVPRGRALFARVCSECHSLAGEAGPGPPLNGVVGRRVGSVPGFGYSPALTGRREVWTEGLLTSFLVDQDAHFAGTSMPPAGVSWLDAPNLIAFLKTTRPSLRPPPPRRDQNVPETVRP